MRRGAVLLVALAGLAASAAPARTEEPRLPPVSGADWEARDAEARWLLYRRSEAPHEDWVAFLESRRETAFLEWVALTSRRADALQALRRLEAPEWVRCAVWSLATVDTHVLGGSQALLTARPALVLAWFDLHPEAAKGPAATLRVALEQKVTTREDASRLLPPLDLTVLLADLVPPAQLHDLSDRTRVEPGHRYVHQVERAIDILVARKWLGEPWVGRLEALVNHGHPAVRRASALAWAHAPPDAVPRTTLLARVDDAAERPEVRSAALIGLSYASDPRAWITLVRVAQSPTHPAWTAAVSRLGDIDDGFAPTRWRDLAVTAAGPAAPALLASSAARIRERVAALDAGAYASRVPVLLDRAAQADLECDPLEGTLVPWTLETVRARAGEDPVRLRLEQLRDAPAVPATRELAAERMERAREYARSTLASLAAPATGGR